MNLRTNKKELILVHATMEPVKPLKNVNILLTPQFYTLKKEILPIKYLYQAKKIAPSLFEGLLDRTLSYDFFVFKEGDAWVFIAYSIKKITDFLREKGIMPEKISKLYFAQQVLGMLQDPIPLGKKEILAAIDDTAVVVPVAALDEMPQLGAFDAKFTPPKGVTPYIAYGSLLSFKQAAAIAVLLIAFAAAYVIEGIWHTQTSPHQQEQELEKLVASYPVLQSKYARESIAAKYKAVDNKERKKREAIKTVSSMLFKGVTLSFLHMDAKNFKAQFKCTDAKAARELQALAKKAQLKTSVVAGSTDVQVEGTL